MAHGFVLRVRCWRRKGGPPSRQGSGLRWVRSAEFAGGATETPRHREEEKRGWVSAAWSGFYSVSSCLCGTCCSSVRLRGWCAFVSIFAQRIFIRVGIAGEFAGRLFWILVLGLLDFSS